MIILGTNQIYLFLEQLMSLLILQICQLGVICEKLKYAVLVNTIGAFTLFLLSLNLNVTRVSLQ